MKITYISASEVSFPEISNQVKKFSTHLHSNLLNLTKLFTSESLLDSYTVKKHCIMV